MNIEQAINDKVREALEPLHVEVNNESRMHGVPPGSETHFKLLVVSRRFEGVGAVDRHRQVNRLLAAEFAAGLHALSLRVLTPDEWERDREPIESPKCLGGSKAD